MGDNVGSPSRALGARAARSDVVRPFLALWVVAATACVPAQMGSGVHVATTSNGGVLTEIETTALPAIGGTLSDDSRAVMGGVDMVGGYDGNFQSVVLGVRPAIGYYVGAPERTGYFAQLGVPIRTLDCGGCVQANLELRGGPVISIARSFDRDATRGQALGLGVSVRRALNHPIGDPGERALPDEDWQLGVFGTYYWWMHRPTDDLRGF